MKTSLERKTKSKRSFSPLDEFSKHRKFNTAIAKYLYQNPLTHDAAHAIANCSQRLNLEFKLKDGNLEDGKLIGGLLCNRRLCPFCEWRRTRILRARLLKGLDNLKDDQQKTTAIFLTDRKSVV